MKKKLVALLAIISVICCALCLVACDKDNVVEVAGIELDQTQITLTEGEKIYLTATVTPSNATDQKIEWTSSNHSVAIVEDGYVVTFGEGTTNVTAKSSNGKTAQCSVIVKKDPNDNYVMEFDVKFDANGGKFPNGSDTFETTAEWGSHLKPVTATRDGKYEFAGWYIKGQPATGAWNFDTNGVFADTTLYASWKYLNDYESIMTALEDRISSDYQKENKEYVEVDILSIYKNDEGYLCFIEKDRYGVTTYKTDICDFEDITADIVAKIPTTNLEEIDNYAYYYNSDNYSYIVDYLPGKYIKGVDCSVIYACVSNWEYDANKHVTTPKIWYSCEVKALMVDGDGNVFTYSATIVSGTTNFNLVVGGGFLSEEFDEVITPLGELANDYYSEYLKDEEASILY
ncbi:MAG: Ig-like domain-containing protein [Clostridia bacterium]|nr:Ig-like domain-containing protein [Clostridia bacterium]